MAALEASLTRSRAKGVRRGWARLEELCDARNARASETRAALRAIFWCAKFGRHTALAKAWALWMRALALLATKSERTHAAGLFLKSLRAARTERRARRGFETLRRAALHGSVVAARLRRFGAALRGNRARRLTRAFSTWKRSLAHAAETTQLDARRALETRDLRKAQRRRALRSLVSLNRPATLTLRLSKSLFQRWLLKTILRFLASTRTECDTKRKECDSLRANTARLQQAQQLWMERMREIAM